MVTEKKWVYKFNEGNAQMRELLGGKGANLAEMTNLGLPIPGSLHGLLQIRPQNFQRDQAADFRSAALAGKRKREEIRRQQRPAAGFRPQRRTGLHAWHDGHDFKSGHERYFRERLCAENK